MLPFLPFLFLRLDLSLLIDDESLSSDEVSSEESEELGELDGLLSFLLFFRRFLGFLSLFLGFSERADRRFILNPSILPIKIDVDELVFDPPGDPFGLSL